MSTASTPKVETWRNVSRGKVFIQKLDRRGEIAHMMVGPEKKFTITPEERRINQDAAYSPDQDFFTNGRFAPVRLIENDEDEELGEENEFFLSNANTMSESDILALFQKGRQKYKKFDETLEQITNPVTLTRMLDLMDSDDYDPTVRQREQVEARLQEVDFAAWQARTTPEYVDEDSGRSHSMLKQY